MYPTAHCGACTKTPIFLAVLQVLLKRARRES
jgi:hypothetical protein